MTQCNSLDVNPSNPLFNKLKSAIRNEANVVSRLSPNMIGNSDDEINFPHRLLLTNRQVANLRQAFPNNSPVNKLSKTKLSNMVQLGHFLGRLLGTLLKTGLTLMKNVIKL